LEGVHAHKTNRTAVPSSAAVVDLITWSCEEAPTACTSNGEPPPESALESCALGVAGRAAVEVATGCCTVPVADPPGSDVGLGSVTIACDEVIDDRVDCACELDAAAVVEVELGGVVANDHDGGATELVPVLDVAVVCACDLVVMVTTSTPGHSDAMPMPNWKTPIMLVSPTSTPTHTLWINAPMSTSPCTHAELQRFGDWKSLATQPLMVDVYAA
jgi:hypothetical protein